jgi:hypothetical protein
MEAFRMLFGYNSALTRPTRKTFEEFDALSKTCAHQARLLVRMANEANAAAVQIWGMAKEYQRAAAELNGGTLPDLGDEPFK